MFATNGLFLQLTKHSEDGIKIQELFLLELVIVLFPSIFRVLCCFSLVVLLDKSLYNFATFCLITFLF